MKIFDKKTLEKIKTKLICSGYEILKINILRNYYCWIRYKILKRKLRILNSKSQDIGEYTIKHNLDALSTRAAYGMGNRMSLLLYPLAAVLININKPKVLIVGPRTEDDIYWARSLGLIGARGLDLFSYSEMIDIGDIHQTDYQTGYFDAVVLGWVISYSSTPDKLIQECKRIVRTNGYLGFGIESNPSQRKSGVYTAPRVNSLNSAADISTLVNANVVFIHDPQLDTPTDNAVIFQLN